MIVSLYNIFLVLGPLCKPLLVMELPNKRLLLLLLLATLKEQFVILEILEIFYLYMKFKPVIYQALLFKWLTVDHDVSQLNKLSEPNDPPPIFCFSDMSWLYGKS